MLNSNISSTGLRNMVNFGALAADICLGVWGTRANFNGFRVLASLLHRWLSTEVSQTLHDVWPSSGLTLCIHFGDCCLLTEFCQVQNSLCVQLLRSPVLTALLHGTGAVGVTQTAAWYKEWNYGTFARHFEQRTPPIFPGRPSRWA